MQSVGVAVVDGFSLRTSASSAVKIFFASCADHDRDGSTVEDAEG